MGAGTVRIDNPRLNVREWKGHNPVRIILSSSGLMPADLEMNKSNGSTIVFTFYPGKITMPGLVLVRLNNHEPSAKQVSDYLFRWGVQSLFIEGGAKVLSHFISAGCWDEARIIYW